LTYKDAGVDIEAGDAWTQHLAQKVRRTYGPRVVSGIGGFAGLFRLDYDERLFQRNYKKPVLVACTDGVGTKLLVAHMAGTYRNVGIDVVAMNVNDLVVTGAEPLLFLDYIATGKINGRALADVMDGISDACYASGCALLGGETAEMPGMYQEGHLDLAGFAVGVVERHKIIDGKKIKPGDVVIGLASNGLHSNGFSLVRKVCFDTLKLKLDAQIAELGCSLAEELLRPTRLYAADVVSVLRRYRVKRVVRGMAHITGGGLAGNVPRCLPRDCTAVIRRDSWKVPPIFKFIQRRGGVSTAEMYRVFNMGIGFVMIVRPSFAEAIMRHLLWRGQEAMIIGRIKRGRGNVELR